MGLSDPGTGGRFRGLHRDVANISRDSFLLSVASRRGRQIWFEPEKKDWLSWLEDTLKHKDFKFDDRPAVRQWDNLDRSGMFSEWVDQEGRHWKDGPNQRSDATPRAQPVRDSTATDYDNLGPYFAITVAAAGWHSGALVLVDEDKAHEIRSQWVVQREEDSGPSVPGAFETRSDEEEYVWKATGFPKVELPDGFTMPGEGEVRPWREGRPSLAELGVTPQAQP